MPGVQIVNDEVERAFLVGIAVRGNHPALQLTESVNELALLAKTAGMKVVGRATQTVNKVDPATFIGSGKVEEIREQLDELGAMVVIFDEELSPPHQRELEKRFGDEVKLLDRSALILDIFAQHANTREGALQVELAQYEYRLPRLTRQWTHLARQAGGGSARGGVGGVGLRGPGETQLEVDRREIGRKIAKLKRDLERVRTQRSLYRDQRTQAGIPTVALVGYTNAGKSTLLRALTGAEIYVADKLFATLDPTTRRARLASGRHVLLGDTVGFIQKLPTTLIAAFRATLEEITEADILLHVVDTTHPCAAEHFETVEDTLAEIDMPPVPRILVWNKLDLWDDDRLPHIESGPSYVAEAMVSASEGTGLTDLLQKLEDTANMLFQKVQLLLPFERGDLASFLHENTTVENRDHTPDGILLTVQLSPTLFERFKQFQIRE